MLVLTHLIWIHAVKSGPYISENATHYYLAILAYLGQNLAKLRGGGELATSCQSWVVIYASGPNSSFLIYIIFWYLHCYYYRIEERGA